MEEFISDAKFLIIKFDEILNDKLVIELVPTSWVSELDSGWVCKYPPHHHYKFLDRWVEEESDPVDTWKTFTDVSIINKAYDYEQGKRRLKRAFTSLSQTESTDIENNKNNKYRPPHISKTLAKSMLTESVILSTQSNLTKNQNITRDLHCSTSHNSERPNSTAASSDDVHQVQGTSNNQNGPARVTRNTTKEKLQQLYEQMDGSQQIFAQYMDLLVTSKVNSAKLSLQYDFDAKINQLKLAMSSSGSNVPDGLLNERQNILISLPIENLNKFLDFDEELNLSLEKQQALKLHFKIITAGFKEYEKDIKTIIASIIKKTVQLEYSGTGRQMRGVGKKNFSATSVYQCLKEFIEEKYRSAEAPPKILSVTSNYLAGSGDREGGRKARTISV
ncbi:uncharacterized protein LOC130678546 [Microplitis mediator]|uniref:uncharacterized protein LOC130678546 n=1 Tax=Microplitis mediator TaxID=375433 RepID=UPI00255440C0|nr:uncharacterized protein LOC130678546 [Microplitis mediator]